MIGIICKLEGDAKKCIPIRRSEDDVMATFDTLEEAKEFTDGHPLCMASDIIYIDLDMVELISG